MTKAERHRGAAGDQQSQHRLVDDLMLGQQRGSVGAEAEKRRVAERDDAGIAEDQIEREREQSEPGDLGEDEMLVRQQPDRGKGDDPEHEFERMPARAGGEPFGGGADGGMRRDHASAPQRVEARENSPCGRQIRTTIMMV